MDRNRHPEGHKVTAASDVALAGEWAELLEERTAKTRGVSLEDARSIVARDTGVPTGKLYSLRRRRLKDIGRSILTRLGEGVIRELQTELRRVEHELHVRTQIGARPDSGETLSLLADRQKIREALGLPLAGEHRGPDRPVDGG